MAAQNGDSSPTLTEQLTANFYFWETRGRGWRVLEYPVELEPPYEPFFHSVPQSHPQQIIDDGRKHTFISSLVERFRQGLKGPPEKEIPSEPETFYDLIPSPFTDISLLKEIRLSFPQSQKINFDQAEQFLLTLSLCTFPLSFEIIGTSNLITVQLVCREPDLNQVRQQMKAYFPEAVLTEQGGYLQGLWDTGKETAIVDFGLSQEFMRPLRIFRGFDPDPLIGVFGALEGLQRGETGLLQVLFQAALHPWPESIMRSVTDFEGRSFFSDAPEMVGLARDKIRKPLFGAVIRAVAQSTHSYRAWEIIKSLGGALTQLANPQSNELIPLSDEDYPALLHQENVLSRQTHRCGMLLNTEELVSLVHPPSVSVRSEKLHREQRKTRAAPEIAIGHQLILGVNHHQNKSITVSLSPEQRLKHMYVIGATGTGKSTLLLSLIIQDIQNGLGITVLDPHGDLIDRILEHVPGERSNDVILLDPSDFEYPVGLNILSAHSEIEKNLLSSDLVSVFRRLSTSWGDQMTSVLGNAILAFLESEEGGTLVDLRRFLVEAEFRKRFLTKVKDPEVVYYWQREFPLLGGKPQAPILTRLDTFLRPKLIRYMVAQKEGLNFEDILNTKKIFLCKLAQGLIGEENAYLLGALIVSKLQQAAMARQAKDVSEREHFFCYIDEFHNFLTPSISALLSGARKYHLGLILAHQELRQLWNRDSEVANSVISNPGTRICFRLGDFDAQKLKEGFSFFEAMDLQNLGIGEAICRIERSEFDFNLKVIEPPQVSSEVARETRERLFSLSRAAYAVSRAEIERRLIQEKIEIPEPLAEEIKPLTIEEKKIPPPKEISKVEVPVMQEKDISQHRYFQALIKRMAEEKGYRAVIEKPTPDGKGKVDVSLEKDGKNIACEISLTTTDEQELRNIEKCLSAGYERVILCSPEKKTLEKVKALVSERLKDADREKVLFLQPEELYLYLEEQEATQAGKEERVKGYRVKVQYQPVKETDKKAKREAVAQVVLQAMKRRKGGK